MNILFVDTETFGIPDDHNASYRDIDNWPDIRQIAWIVTDKDLKILIRRNFFAKQVDIEEISDNYTEARVKPIHEVLKILLADFKSCDVVIGHNIEYDVNVIASQLYRYGINVNKFVEASQFCTMHASIPFCGFDTSLGERYPKLQELYCKLFSKPFVSAHDAFNDIWATYECTKALFSKKILQKSDYSFLLTDSEKRKLSEDYFLKGWEILVGHRSGSLKDTERLYKKAAELGHVEAMSRLGSLHAGNWLVSIDLNVELAKEWYNKAISHGNFDSYKDLSHLFGKIGNATMKTLYMKKYVEFKRAQAQEQLSHPERLNNIELQELVVALMNGNEYIEKDEKRGYELAQYGIEHHKINKHYFGKILRDRGDLSGYFHYLTIDFDFQKRDFYGRKNNRSRDFYWWDNRNFCEYLTEVAICYYEGYGVERDFSMAFQLLNEALSIYIESDKNNLYLGRFYQYGHGVCKIDYRLAFSYYTKAQSELLPESYYRLATLYYSGNGTKRSLTKAMELIGKCEKLNYSEGVDRLKQDISKARRKNLMVTLSLICIMILILLGLFAK